jgi:hypothetical protein
MQVFDLSDVNPREFVDYGLVCLEKLADLGDYCAKDTRDKLRIMVCFAWYFEINALFLDRYMNDRVDDAISCL